jgi:hypothetical protein
MRFGVAGAPRPANTVASGAACLEGAHHVRLTAPITHIVSARLHAEKQEKRLQVRASLDVKGIAKCRRIRNGL